MLLSILNQTLGTSAQQLCQGILYLLWRFKVNYVIFAHGGVPPLLFQFSTNRISAGYAAFFNNAVHQFRAY